MVAEKFNYLVKNLTAAGVLRRNIWFSLPIPKITFDPPAQGEKWFGAHILGPKSKRNDKKILVWGWGSKYNFRPHPYTKMF